MGFNSGFKGLIIIIIIINIKDWTLWSVPSPELQLLLPTFLRSFNCSPSLWSVVVWLDDLFCLYNVMHCACCCLPVSPINSVSLSVSLSLSLSLPPLLTQKFESPLHFYPSLSRALPPTAYSDWSDKERGLIFFGWPIANYQKFSLNFRGMETPTT